mmetsp:Transcript_121339/g.343808  ORF Transcript_121339/g.343808 Transcript_121339/m.343808 type:complete len:553 (-) Transcript_121339:209-1867(-)
MSPQVAQPRFGEGDPGGDIRAQLRQQHSELAATLERRLDYQETLLNELLGRQPRHLRRTAGGAGTTWAYQQPTTFTLDKFHSSLICSGASGGKASQAPPPQLHQSCVKLSTATACEDEPDADLGRSSTVAEDEPRRQQEADARRSHPSVLRLAGRAKATLRSAAVELVGNPLYDCAIATAIFASSAFIGVETEFEVQHPGEAHPPIFAVAKYCFATVFLLELLVRVAIEGRTFFWSKNWGWNLFDFVIVLDNTVEIAIEIVFVAYGSEFAGTSLLNVRVLRILRITRLIRAFRFLRVVRFVSNLRALVHSIASTLKSLVWVFVLLLLIIYTFAIALTQESTAYLMAEEDPDPGATKYWGNLSGSMYTLFKVLTQGVSWQEAIDPLEQVSQLAVSAFLFFVFFTYFAILNVVTGIFCNKAIEAAARDPDTMASSLQGQQQEYVEHIKELFREIDSDESGTLTVAEFEIMMTNESMQNQLRALELDPADAWTLFKLINTTRGSTIDINSFVEGCIRLKGYAKSIDLAWLATSTESYLTTILKQLQALEARFDPS